MIPAQVLVDHLNYSKWATGLLLEAAAALEPGEIERDLKSAYGGVLGTLQHIFLADRIWLSRFEGRGRTTMLDDGEAMPEFERLRMEWPPLLDRFQALVADFGDAGVGAEFTYRNLSGKQFTMPRWQALLHVVNHATLHRGQTMAMFRQLGHKPPATDLLFYFQR
ncbi:MAG: DinB family protein [Bryobacteraceae bacterium]|nr:DinB family protein [Bryobacteraceae bacterium]